MAIKILAWDTTTQTPSMQDPPVGKTGPAPTNAALTALIKPLIPPAPTTAQLTALITSLLPPPVVSLPDPITVQATEFNVKRFGAKGDGLTDDTAAVQRTHDAMLSGGRACFPRGLYLMKRVVTGVDPFQNWATRLKSGNITVMGDGIGQSVIRAMDEYTTLFLGHDSFRNISFRDLTLQGSMDARYPVASSFSSPTGATGALVTLFGPQNGFMEDIDFTRVEFLDVKSVGLYIGNAWGVNISGCKFYYYDSAPVLSATIINGNGPQVGVFSGGDPVYDVTMDSGCKFDGNVHGTDITHHGADGIAWGSKGGNWLITGCQVRNYKLEGVQGLAGPFTVNDNQFYTRIGNADSCAISLWHGGGQIDEPSYTANGNQVVGGSAGIITSSIGTVLPSSITAIGNRIKLNRDLPESNGIALMNHTDATIIGNRISGCLKGLNNTGGLIEHLTFNGNTLKDILDIGILLNSPIGKTANITGNTVQRIQGMNALHLIATRGATDYILQLKNNFWLDPNGNDEGLVSMIAPNAGAGNVIVRGD